MTQLSQMTLCGIILKEIAKQGCKDVLPRQMKAVSMAANIICAEFAIAYKPSVPGGGLAQWLGSDDRGISSNYLLHAIRDGWNKTHQDFGYPHDPGDFGRCVGLLDAAPELRTQMQSMCLATVHGDQWAALACNWPELEALYREELPSGKAPKLMARMMDLTKEGA